MPEQIRVNKEKDIEYKLIWRRIHKKNNNVRVIEVYKTNDGRVLITLSNGKNKIGIMMTYDEISGMVSKLTYEYLSR